ncbi:MAG: hypothetical protein AB7H77_12010 [Bdellovibrionales bacterium]
MFKKIAAILAVLIILAGLGAYYLWSNLDYFVKTAIEKYGTAATQTAVRLDSVKLDLATGQAILNGLTVANPQGFMAGDALSLGIVSVKLDTGSISGDGPIIIDEVLIDKPKVNFELTNGGNTNLQALQRNTQEYAASLAGKQNKAPEANPKAASATSPSEGTRPARKFIIKKLTVSGGGVNINQESLKDRQLTTALPTIHMSNIGQATAGATVAEVAQQLMGSISTAAAQTAVTTLAREKLKGTLENVPAGAIGGAAVDAVGEQLKGVFGQ